ncbi:LAMI_0A05776g1_1 [Lachancea mirantina]|uniref:LAMI_0A05776g1_1 n=1 Tax=Lachancea mirantina TaxID=1230905 RepID=A0A1G4IPT8_9SACH|nr:LAMI_0A05776g1_1 [Lachancea mirantina]
MLSGVTNRFGRRIQLNESFAGDVEAGLNSDNFDVLHHNEHDERNGLDDKAKNDIKKIMMDKNLSFDEARLSYMRDTFTEHGIAQDGTPKDPRTVTFARD